MQVLPITSTQQRINKVNFSAISVEHLNFKDAAEALDRAAEKATRFDSIKMSSYVDKTDKGYREAEKAYYAAKDNFSDYLDRHGMSQDLIDNEKKYR